MPISSPNRFLTALTVIIAFAILIALGMWQLHRKAWKEALVADLGSRSHSIAVALPATWSANRDEFRHVFATGKYLNEMEISVYGLMEDGPRQTLQGAYLFTPFQLSDGGVVMVNRGFVPKDVTNVARVHGEARIEGILRAPEQHSWFVPENIPAKAQWFTRDSTMMAQSLGVKDAPSYYIEADAASAGAATPWPKGGTTRTITLKNDHLQYALTWFGLALVLVGVAGYATVKGRTKRLTNL